MHRDAVGEGAFGPWRVYRRVLSEARAYWPHLAGLLLLSLLSTPLALLHPVPLAIAVDSVIGSRPLPGFLQAALPDGLTRSPNAILVVAAVLVVLVALLSRLRSLVKGVLKTYTGQRLVLDVRAKLLAQAQRLSLTYHDTRGTTDSTYRIHTDAAAIQTLATGGLIPFVSAGVQLVTMLVIIWAIDAQLALVALVIIPALFLALRANAGRLRTGWHGVKEIDSSIMSVIQEILGGLRVVKAFGQEEHERRRYLHHGVRKVRARTKLALLENGLSLLIGLIVAVGTALVLFLGVNGVRDGDLTLGSLLLVMSYLSQLYGPLESIADKIAAVQSSLVSAERAFRLLDLPPDVPERPDARPLRRALGRVALERVSFGYDEDHPVLHELSIDVASGRRVGIAGATGAGKSTLVNLLTRFYDPTSGRVLLDGVDLRDYRLADLRNQFAIVLQEPVLFSTSIAENIAYARPGASFADIMAAAKAADVHDFITGLPDGYDTGVGERGLRLSGGERQRVALARAFLKDAPILILDEPTSSVDVHTEAAIMGAMTDLMRGRTTFMIAHRLGTLDYCDMRLELSDGRIVETASRTGPHPPRRRAARA